MDGKVRAKRRKKNKALFLVVTVLLVFLLWGVFGLRIKEIQVSGNDHYSKEEVSAMIRKEGMVDNTLFVYLKYKMFKEETVPFIDKIDLTFVDIHTLSAEVYEKKIVGYFEYLGSYLYFDKDGIIVESSSDLIEGIPQITGLKFHSVELYKELPVESDEIFDEILSLTQALSKYEIVPDKVFIDSELDITLYFENAKVLMGKNKLIDEKMSRLKSILPNLEGLSGKLHMEDFTKETKDITFEKDK